MSMWLPNDPSVVQRQLEADMDELYERMDDMDGYDVNYEDTWTEQELREQGFID